MTFQVSCRTLLLIRTDPLAPPHAHMHEVSGCLSLYVPAARQPGQRVAQGPGSCMYTGALVCEGALLAYSHFYTAHTPCGSAGLATTTCMVRTHLWSALML